MSEKFLRTEMLLGKDAMEKLKNARVAIFGVGGVGGYTLEALARCGVENIDIIDNDVVSESNINRQIIALTHTVGRKKVDVAKERVIAINPDAKVCSYDVFFDENTEKLFDFSSYDYVVDAIDSVKSKILLIEKCKTLETKIISSMGAGNKLNPAGFEVSDIYKTSVCPLARVLRKELKLRGIKSLKVVYSKELPIKPDSSYDDEKEPCRHVPGSISFVPSCVGLIVASEVVKDLIYG